MPQSQSEQVRLAGRPVGFLAGLLLSLLAREFQEPCGRLYLESGACASKDILSVTPNENQAEPGTGSS